MKNMVQYTVLPNCTGNCDFCLRDERFFLTKQQILDNIELIKKNIPLIDWKDQFQYGISLLGGEIYYMQDKDYQDAFLDLIDTIIEKVLKVSDNPECKYSSVTNGMYNPDFLFKVIDRIVEKVGIQKVDLNFSFDLKYRFKTKEQQQQVLNNINAFHKRYNYKVGVQMILAQYLIDMWKKGQFKTSEFIEKYIPGNMICYLYPHPIRTGKELPDFFFKRKDFLDFVLALKIDAPEIYKSFLQSTKNSAIFKYTGLIHKNILHDYKEMPILSDGKEIINEQCGHSILYKCYSDCDRCMMCDLKQLDKGEYL